MSANGHPRLFFLHIPKCAGSTLHAAFEREYPPEAIYTVPSVAWNDKNFASLRDEWSAERRAAIRVIKGHMNYGWHKAFGDDDYEYITLLRHPVERILSFYSYIDDWHPDGGHKGDGLAAFVERSPEAHNHATYMLSGGMGRDEAAFTVAWIHLTKTVVGTVEHYARFEQALCDRYGWGGGPVERLNETPDRLRDIDETVEHYILRRNNYDLLLYGYAKRRELCPMRT